MTQLKRIVWFASIATPLLLLPCRIAAQSAPSSKSGGLEETTARSSRLAEEYARLPLSSEANTGQYHGNTNFGGSNSAPLSIVINAASTSYSTNTIPTGTGPIAAALNPTTHTLFVANQGSNNVTAIDTRTNSILATIPVDQAPSAIGVNTSTNQVYVANRDSADITIIDGATYNTTNIVVASVDVVTPPSLLPFHPIAIAVNQQTGQVYVGSTDCDFAVVTGNVVTHPGSFLCGPIALAVSPLTGRAFVAESHDSTIEEYQALTNFLLNGPGFNGFIAPQALAFNPPFAYAADGQGAVEEINEVTGANSHVTIAGNVYAIAANPVDGEVYAASQSSAAGQASNVTVISGNVVDVTLPVGQTPVPAPVPAPNKIAVDSTNHLVFVVNEASNDVTVIDVSALAVLSAVPVGTTPTAIVLNPERCNTYVTNFGSGTVTVLNPQSNGPGICLGSNSLTFPEQFVNTKSAPQTVTLTNIGNANLLISSIVTSPNVFIESDNCGPVAPATTSAIAPGAQCQIQAAFAPTTPGFVTGKILITDNATNSPQTIVLTGNAVLPPTVTLAVNANPAVFGQIVTLTARVAGSQGTPTGTVTFLDGQTVLDIRPLAADGTASITPTLSAVGVRNLTANYSGDLVSGPGSSAVLTETVNKAATQIIILSSSITSNVGASVTFETSIQIAPPGSGNAQEPGGQLAFYDGQTLLGSVPIKNATANFTTSSLSAGSHSRLS